MLQAVQCGMQTQSTLHAGLVKTQRAQDVEILMFHIFYTIDMFHIFYIFHMFYLLHIVYTFHIYISDNSHILHVSHVLHILHFSHVLHASHSLHVSYISHNSHILHVSHSSHNSHILHVSHDSHILHVSHVAYREGIVVARLVIPVMCPSLKARNLFSLPPMLSLWRFQSFCNHILGLLLVHRIFFPVSQCYLYGRWRK